MLANFGVDHKRAPLAVLDSLTLRDPQGFYRILRNTPGVKGSLILQTCNRVEFYLDTKDQGDFADKVLWYWALETRFKLGELAQVVEKRQGNALVAHLVRLGSGLESMLVGEPQVLGQLKNALAEADAQGATSPLLSELFEKAIKGASRIREQTGIGRGTVSLGSAAIKLAEETLGPVRNCSVLLIGTGQVGMMAVKALKARQVDNISVAGRTRQRAESFCRAYGGTPIDFRKVQSYLPSMDLVIVATKATNHLLTREMLAPTIEARTRSRLMVLDLSSPRNVSPDVQELQQVTLKTIEDLREIAEEALARRKALVQQAEPLVKQKADEILNLLHHHRKTEPAVSDSQVLTVAGHIFGGE